MDNITNNTTNITDLPPVVLGDQSIDKGEPWRLDEGQIRQLVTGIQDASLKGATRLRSTDIPNDPSSITVDPETIIPTVEYPTVIDEPPKAVAEVHKHSLLDNLYVLSQDIHFQLAIGMGLISIAPQVPTVSFYIKKYAPWTLTDLGAPSIIGYITYFVTFATIYYILFIVFGYNR